MIRVAARCISTDAASQDTADNRPVPMIHIDSHSELFAKLQQHAERVNEVERYCTDEAKTRNYLVEPLLEALGYDCSDPRDVACGFISDVAGKSGETYDYALMRDGKPVVFVEVKTVGARLGGSEREQLQRFIPFTPGVLTVMTDGIRWHWYKGRSERDQSHQMESSPFLTYDAREPSEASAEWLSQLTKDGFNPEELLRISRRNDLTAQISDWIGRTLVNPSDTAAVELRKVVGLDASIQETPLVVDAIRAAWTRVVGGPINIPTQDTTASEEIEIADEPVGVPDSQQPTETPTVTVPSTGKLRFVSHESDQFDVGDGKVLSRHTRQRAWKIGGQDWQIEVSGTRLTTVLLGHMLACDSRRDNADALVHEFGLRTFDEPPHWNWERVPGFSNLYYNKNISAQQKRDFLAHVADNLLFDPPEDHPLGKSGKIEWWLPRLNR